MDGWMDGWMDEWIRIFIHSFIVYFVVPDNECAGDNKPTIYREMLGRGGEMRITTRQTHKIE